MTRKLEIAGSAWLVPLDFYNAILLALGSPDWHGRNLNALIDSMIWGGINSVEPPYTICISGCSNMPSDVRSEIQAARSALATARTEFIVSHGREVKVELEMAL